MINPVRTVCTLTLTAMAALSLSGCLEKKSEPMPETTAEAWQELFNSRKAQALVSMYTDDCILMPPEEPSVTGRQAVMDFYLPLLRHGFTMERTNEEAETRADVTLRRGTYVVKDRHGEVTERGKYMQLWRMQEDGKWRLSREIWNTDEKRKIKPPVLMN